MTLEEHTIRTTPAGAAGSSVADVSTNIRPGILQGIFVDYTSQPATTDVTISNRGRNLLVLTNVNTDGVYQPRVLADDAAGVDIAGQHVAPAVGGAIRVQVAQGDPVDGGVLVTLLIER